jgi:hypothetical protein
MDNKFGYSQIKQIFNISKWLNIEEINQKYKTVFQKSKFNLEAYALFVSKF